MTRTGSRPSGQRGSGTLLIMAVVMIMLWITASLAVVGRYLVVRQRAESAADLAALAGAQAYGGGADGCDAARRYAAKNGQRMTDCSTVGDRTDFVLSVRVVAEVPVRVSILPAAITVEAHAGPVNG